MTPTRLAAFAASALIAGLLAACGVAVRAPVQAPIQPEGPSAYVEKAPWTGRRFAVAAANPLATEAGYRILRAGGSAIDAAVAVQMVLGLVEPQSSGIGGGAFLLHFDGRRVEAFDGRETAPAAVDGQLFMGADGRPLPFMQAIVGGRPVGVPGVLRMLEMAHRQHGRLPWARLFEPAITLAERGFAISPRLHALLVAEDHLQQDPVARAYFHDAQGRPRPIGHVLKNPDYAAVLRMVAERGSRGLHEGEVAEAIVDKIRSHPGNPGRMTLADLSGYRARKREPICVDYSVRAAASEPGVPGGRDYRICGMPPPSSGGIAVAQILGMLENIPAAAASGLQDGLPQAQWLHLYTEAARLAFADRALYVADPDYVRPPAGDWRSLVAPAYLAERARLIGPHSMKTAPAGRPGGVRSGLAPMPGQPEYGTSHISIIDGSGSALAMTTSIEDGWGARQMVRGFLLNNQLSDFSFVPTDAQGRPVANRVEPGKRPRSSMAPTLVFDRRSGELLMTAGSPGGPVIIHFVAKAIYGMLNWGLTPQQAVSLPNFAVTSGPLMLEQGRFPAATRQALQARGHTVRETPMPSGVQALRKSPDGLSGGADPRREGLVLGD